MMMPPRHDADPVPHADRARDLDRLDFVLFHLAPFQEAVTRRKSNPHSYTLRKRWRWRGGDADFVFAFHMIQTLGELERWPHAGGRAYCVATRPWPTAAETLTVRFWTSPGRAVEDVILINRTPVVVPPPDRYTRSSR